MWSPTQSYHNGITQSINFDGTLDVLYEELVNDLPCIERNIDLSRVILAPLPLSNSSFVDMPSAKKKTIADNSAPTSFLVKTPTLLEEFEEANESGTASQWFHNKSYDEKLRCLNILESMLGIILLTILYYFCYLNSIYINISRS